MKLENIKDLSKTERKVLGFIRQRKYTSPMLIKIYYGMNKDVLNRVLLKLESRRFISRPIKGLILDNLILETNPTFRERIEHNLEKVIR